MVNHESKCDNNPANAKACSNCKHLTKVEMEIWFNDMYGHDGFYKKKEVFKCALLDTLMFPYKIEKKDLHNRFPSTYDEQQPMPKDCDKREEEDFCF